MDAHKIDKLLQETCDKDESVRRNAAELIGETRLEKGITKLALLLEDPCVGVAEASTDALISIGTSKVAETLFLLLDSEDAGVRNRVCEILEKIGEPAHLSVLKAMESSNKDVRKMAADIAGSIGSSVFTPSLKKLLKDKEVNVASSAAEALGQIKDPDSILALAEAFNGDVWLKCSAIKALGSIGGKEAAQALEQLSPDEEDIVVFSVVNAIGDLGEISTIPFLAKVFEWSRPFMASSVFMALEKIINRGGKNAVEVAKSSIQLKPFLSLLSDSDKSVRLSAVRMMGLIKNEKAFLHILPLLLEEDDEIREAAKISIISIGPSDLSPVTYILQSKDTASSIKEAVVEIIGELKWKDGTESLLATSQDADVNLRRQIVISLGKIGTVEALTGIKSALKSEDGHIRKEAALALARIGTASACEDILTLFKDPYKDVREGAALAVVSVNHEGINKKLVDLTRSKISEDRRLAIIAIANSSMEEKLNILFSALKDESWEIRWTAVESLSSIFSQGDTTDDVGAGSKPAQFTEENELIALLDDEAQLVRMGAVGLISRILPDTGIIHLIHRLQKEKDQKVRYELVMSLGKADSADIALPVLLELLTDCDDLIKAATLTALGELRDARAIADIENFLESDNCELSEAAELALEKISETENLR